MAIDKQHAWNVGYWLLAFVVLLWAQGLWQTATRMEPVPYSEFEKALADGRIDEVSISDRSIVGHLKTPDGRTTTATRVEPDLAARLEKFGVRYTRVVDSTLLRDLMSWVIPALV